MGERIRGRYVKLFFLHTRHGGSSLLSTLVTSPRYATSSTSSLPTSHSTVWSRSLSPTDETLHLLRSPHPPSVFGRLCQRRDIRPHAKCHGRPRESLSFPLLCPTNSGRVLTYPLFLCIYAYIQGLPPEVVGASSVFTGEEEIFAFARACSRLVQMGSREWAEGAGR